MNSASNKLRYILVLVNVCTCSIHTHSSTKIKHLCCSKHTSRKTVNLISPHYRSVTTWLVTWLLPYWYVISPGSTALKLLQYIKAHLLKMPAIQRIVYCVTCWALVFVVLNVLGPIHHHCCCPCICGRCLVQQGCNTTAEDQQLLLPDQTSRFHPQ